MSRCNCIFFILKDYTEMSADGGTTMMSLPKLPVRRVPRRYEETKPVMIQGCAHSKILGKCKWLHKFQCINKWSYHTPIMFFMCADYDNSFAWLGFHCTVIYTVTFVQPALFEIWCMK